MSMPMLPEELITEILYRLPAKSLLRFRCVSNAWFAQIKDPNFIDIHLQKNREPTLIVQTLQRWKSRNVWGLDLNYYLVNFSNEDQPVEIFPSFSHQEIFSSLKIVDCCCNGLVCVRTYDGDAVIWNPSIRKFNRLPFEPTEYKKFTNDNFAFVYDPINNDYKVLRVVEYFESYSSLFGPFVEKSRSPVALQGVAFLVGAGLFGRCFAVVD